MRALLAALVLLAAACGDPATTTTSTAAPPATTTTSTSTTTTPPTTTTTTTVPQPALDHVAFDGDDHRLQYTCTEGAEHFAPFAELMGGVSFDLADGQVSNFVFEFVRYAFEGQNLTATQTVSTLTITGEVVATSTDWEGGPVPISLAIDRVAMFPCLQLQANGLRAVSFGDDPDEVVATLTRRMGEPLDDTGWFEAEICIGSVLRTVKFRDTYVFFTDGETPYAPEGRRHFAAWEMIPLGWASDAAGIRPGSSFEELEAAHGPLDFEFSVVYERWEATTPEGILVVVDAPEPGGTVTSMEAGPFICGE